VFRRLAGELERASDQSPALALNANHRSSAELVAFFNAFFPGVFGPAERDFEARFSEVRTSKSPTQDAPPATEFHLLEPPDPESAEADEQDVSLATAEARAAAARIASGAAAGEFAFADVCVLFRSTTRQHEYERAFRERGIPYQAADPRGLFAEGPANDIYAVLRLCLFPQDRNAYAALLRSPFVRLGDESLARILLDERRDSFPEDAPAAWFSCGADAARYRRGAELYRSVRADVDLTGVSDLVSRLWYDEGYLASLMTENRAAENVDHFDKLYALALDADRRGCPWRPSWTSWLPSWAATRKSRATRPRKPEPAPCA
jgi:ATP-dependent helicase/nuclease subunit A